ncbi:hypothetical protein QCA50_006970 [Cerrena zonata]|uniref:PH domain-containing protein n=1 Tax=Cerrena zonata TaxID=2478898 RepID=A0AAW0GA58_9APHY
MDAHIPQCGTVRVKQAGFFNWLWRPKYLVLKGETLMIHKNEDTPVASLIKLSDITNIERTVRKPHCLLLELKDRRFYLSLESDDELYGWQDAINSRRFSETISQPFNFQHRVHAHFDPDTGYAGLPDAWRRELETSDNDCRTSRGPGGLEAHPRRSKRDT